MSIKIALAGNPNSGKTTLFNALTGSNQFVGNWPGVTVEKKEGRLKKHDDVIITDLPGIYSLSPYTLEEVVARNYLIDEKPDAILNIVDGTNLERNLYLTTQLVELDIPVVIAINMIDIVRKNGDKLDVQELSKRLGCKIIEVSALKGDGVIRAAEEAIKAVKEKKKTSVHSFSESVEYAVDYIEKLINPQIAGKRWCAVKVFEHDEKIIEKLSLDGDTLKDIEEKIRGVEAEFDDDSESIMANERYIYISDIIKGCYKKKGAGQLTNSDKIDKIVTNRYLGLPIFAVIMFLVYYISMVSVGTAATDWANDGLFGDGWHLFGIGSSGYSESAEEFDEAYAVINGYIEAAEESGIDSGDIASIIDSESEDFDPEKSENELALFVGKVSSIGHITYTVVDEETMAEDEAEATYNDLIDAVEVFVKYGCEAPDPASYGIWVPGIPAIVENILNHLNCAQWLSGLILDGIIAGVGAVLGFVPQMLVLFLLLAILEACGYMARIAFVLDRIFRKFGLSGKSFIPMLVGTGCGVPGIMASRTIENDRDRKMTIMTTTFIPCGAKVPFIAMIAGAVFGGSAYVATSAYFIGMAAIIVSGIILKKTKMFAGDPAPFVMELPSYHIPTVGNVLRSMWERGWSFIKKAGTIILLSTILVWFTSFFGFADGKFRMLSESEINMSILAKIGGCIAWIFKPLGWGTWQATVASITGLVAKENIVGTMGILYGGEGSVYGNIAREFTAVSAYSFLVFNLLCAPCFAAIGAIKREMNNTKWTWFAIGYQCLFAYIISLLINQIGSIFTGGISAVGLIAAIVILVLMIYLLFRPYKEATSLK